MRILIAAALAVALGAVAFAQQWTPPTPKNLQVLPKDMPPKAVIIVPTDGQDTNAFEDVAKVLKKKVYRGKATIVKTKLVDPGAADKLFRVEFRTSDGEFSWDTAHDLSSVLTIRNYSAVTGACLLTRRSVFEQLGGFDESFPIDFNDVDYCLRVRRLGLRVVYTPHAELVHYESGTMGLRTQAGSEVDRFRDRWTPVLSRDPYYNPNLTRDRPDWGLGEKL